MLALGIGFVEVIIISIVAVLTLAPLVAVVLYLLARRTKGGES